MRTNRLVFLLVVVPCSSLEAQIAPPAQVQEQLAATTRALLDKARKAEVVETMAAAAEQRYVDAERGAKIAARLREQLSGGLTTL